MRMLAYIGLFISLHTMGMSRVLSPASRIGQRNNRITVQAPRNFGKTHFILGYKDIDFEPVQGAQVTDKVDKSDKKEKKVSIPRDNGASLINPNRQTQSFFTSIHDVSSIILEVMGQAKKTLYVAAFTLTDMRVVDQLLKSHKNGVEVCVFVDQGNMKTAYSKVPKLIENGIQVWSYSPALHTQKKAMYEPIMHHKCILVDRELVVTGSANLTKAGQKHNIENINILRDKQAVGEHHEEVERLKKFCIECKLQAAA